MTDNTITHRWYDSATGKMVERDYTMSEEWKLDKIVEDNLFKILFSPEGDSFTISYDNGKLFKYILRTPWDMKSAEYDDPDEYNLKDCTTWVENGGSLLEYLKMGGK